MSTITVTDTASLQHALSSAQGGDTVLLQSGTYSGLSLQNLNFGSGVTVASADPTHQAVLTNFNMSNIQGLTFSHLDFKVLTPAYVGFNVYSSQHVTFDQVHMYGPSGAPNASAEGIRFFDSSYLTFSNSEVAQVAHGVSFARSDHIVVSGNNIHDVNSDTLDFVQVSNVLVTGNALHDFYPTNGAHPDAMQFGTANATFASHDVTITDNLIYRGAGQNSQGIFVSDDVGGFTYSNFTITNNVVVGTGSSGIRPTSVDNLTVSGNQLVSFVGGDVTNMLLQNDSHVTLSNNTASSIGFPTVTALVETGDLATAAKVTDSGAAVIQNWLAHHTVGESSTTVGLLQPLNSLAQANQAPNGGDNSTTLAWHASKTFTASDFGFSDPDGNHLAAVKISGLPTSGVLLDNGVAVTQGQLISVADINAGKLAYAAPTTGAAQHVDISFQVQDDGGIANGGVNTDQTANIYHLEVAAQLVDHAPSGADAAFAVPWQGGKVFGVADFGFSDSDGNQFAGVRITSLPAMGSLTDNGGAVGVGQTISAADIAAGRFVYSAPATTAATSSGFGFQVVDDGAGATSGSNTDPAIHTVYLDVAAKTDTALASSASSASGPGVTMTASQANTVIHSGSGNDTIVGAPVQDYLRGDDGNDSISGGAAFDDINGNVGNDTAHGNGGDDWVVGGKGDDLLYGDAGNDLVLGNLGADTLDGGAGNDVLRGGQGDDVLTGGDGNDYVSGDLGANTVTGGAGADTFHAWGGGGNDRVLDFNQAQGDHVQLDVGTTYTATQVGADTVILMNGGNEMTLVGVQLSSLHSGWISVG